MIWSNVRKTSPGIAVRGPRLEFRPFTLDHHQQYKCLIKSQRTNEILRTLIFDTYANIHEKIDRKPKLNLTMDTSRLFPQGELRLICSGSKSIYSHSIEKKDINLSFAFLDTLNQYHQWTFDDQVPRSKIDYDLSNNDYTSIMIIPDFDLDVDSGQYQCSTTNQFGTIMKEIFIDKQMFQHP